MVFCCRHKHKHHRKGNTEDVADAGVTDEDSLRHGMQPVLYLVRDTYIFFRLIAFISKL